MNTEHPLLNYIQQHASQVSRALACHAYDMGLAITRPGGTTLPIPIAATPVIIDHNQLRHRADVAATLSSAASKMASSILSGERRDELLNAMSPLEKAIAIKTCASLDTLVTTRIDYFIGASDDQPYALEINATIPAMQGYSDIALESFLHVMSEHLNIPDTQHMQLLQSQPSNARALFEALLHGYQKRTRATAHPRRLGILCHPLDAQLTELQYLQRKFCQWGLPTDIIHPHELYGTEYVMAHRRAYDLIYRHIFVRRLEEPQLEGAGYVQDVLGKIPDTRTIILNPPATQIEIKTTFALLSQAIYDDELARCAGLSQDERHTIAQYIPWTRVVTPGASVGPGGEQVDDLVELIASNPKRFVLKRTWDYGGRTVFIGVNESTPAFQDRVRAAFGHPMTWRELCIHAAQDRRGGGFVVQEFIVNTPQKHFLCSLEGVTETDLYVDFSSYASVGLDHSPAWGGVCRGSSSHIVNIVGGGGVLPLITTEIADELLRFFQAQHP